MAITMAGRECSVEGCGREGVNKVSYVNARVLEEHGYKLKVYGARPPRRPGYVLLCDEHYKLWKKLFKREEKAERLARKGA